MHGIIKHGVGSEGISGMKVEKSGTEGRVSRIKSGYRSSDRDHLTDNKRQRAKS